MSAHSNKAKDKQGKDKGQASAASAKATSESAASATATSASTTAAGNAAVSAASAVALPDKAKLKERKIRRERLLKLAAPIAIVALLLIWELVCVLELVPSYMLPSPVEVVDALIEDWSLLMEHAGTTLGEAALGLLLGIALGFAAAVLMDRFEVVRRAFYPLIVLTQTVPTVAIAPLLVLWFGYGMAPKVVLIIVSTFFPITVGLIGGFDSVDPDEIDLMRSMGASWGQIMWHCKLPSALPQFFSGLKISSAYAIVGAVIAEWLGGFSGLGVYMTRVRNAYSFDKMFAVIIIISVLSLVLMWLVELLERLLTPWERAEHKQGK